MEQLWFVLGITRLSGLLCMDLSMQRSIQK